MFARLVVVGADGGRLHEEVMLAAAIVPGHGRSRRIELEQPRYPGCGQRWKPPWNPTRAASPRRQNGRPGRRWPELEPLLATDVQARAAERLASLQKTLDPAARGGDPQDRGRVLLSCALTLQTALEGPGPVQLTFDDLEIADRQQLERDRHAWQSPPGRAWTTSRPASWPQSRSDTAACASWSSRSPSRCACPRPAGR